MWLDSSFPAWLKNGEGREKIPRPAAFAILQGLRGCRSQIIRGFRITWAGQTSWVRAGLEIMLLRMDPVPAFQVQGWKEAARVFA